jgi:hypothetical protein
MDWHGGMPLHLPFGQQLVPPHIFCLLPAALVAFGTISPNVHYILPSLPMLLPHLVGRPRLFGDGIFPILLLSHFFVPSSSTALWPLFCYLLLSKLLASFGFPLAHFPLFRLPLLPISLQEPSSKIVETSQPKGFI